jgi:hypothetical protein
MDRYIRIGWRAAGFDRIATGRPFDLKSTHAVGPQGGLLLSAPDRGPAPEVPPLLLSFIESPFADSRLGRPGTVA